MMTVFALSVTVLAFWLVVVRLMHAVEDRQLMRGWEIGEIVDRAEEQHAQCMNGDDRGIYGDYPPADLRS